MKNFKTLKIITAILYAVATAFITYLLINGSTENGLALAVFLIVFLVYGTLALSVPLISAIVGLIKSIFAYKNSNCTKATLIYFGVFTVLPVLTWVLFFFIPRLFV